MAVMCRAEKQAQLDRQGRRFDAMLAAERQGRLGAGYRLIPTSAEE
jgi:hypothetical protein